MSSWPEFGVKRPVTNLMIFSGIIIISLYSITRLGLDMMPEIEPPQITVVASYPGASPEDVEIRVTEPLENQLASTPGVEKITSSSRQGLARVRLQFKWGINLDEASNDVRDRIDRAKRTLPAIPDEMEEPFLFKFNTSLMPIVFIGVTADHSYPELYDLIDRRVGDPLRQIPGVGTVNLNGGLERQINILLDRSRLEAYRFSILDVQRVIGQENLTAPVGTMKSGLTDYALRLPGEFATPDQIRSVILGSRNGRTIYLKDVATIEDGFKEVTGIVRIDRRRGMVVSVQKQTGVNTVEVARRVQKKLAEIQATLPSDVQLLVIADNSQDIVDSLAALKSTVWQGGVFVVLVTWFFLRRLLPSMIIALTIPFSLLIAFIYLFMSGRTINTISLSSLTIAIGMVVDNAIVVVDNVMRHLDRGNRPQESAIYGTKEMFLAIAASTGTTIAVFLPMLFVSGVVGIMFGELAAIVCVTLVASLFTATTFTPMLCAKWLGRKRVETRPRFGEPVYNVIEKFLAWMEQGYGRILGRCLRHRWVVLIGCVAIFVASLQLTRFVGNEFIPEADSGDLRVTAQLPVGTRLEETDKVAQRIEDLLDSEVPEKRVSSVVLGQTSGIRAAVGGASGSHIISAGARLVPKLERQRSSRDIAQALRRKIAPLPGVGKTDLSFGSPIGRLISGGGGKDVQIEVIGNSLEETDEVASRVKELMESIPGAVDAAVSREIRRPEFEIRVDREKTASLGLNMRTISDTVKACIEGSVASRYRESGQSHDILVRLSESSRSRPEDIKSIMVVSPYTGRQIRLDSIAEIVEGVGPVEIERKNRERVVNVECNTYGRSSGEVVDDIRRGLAGMTIPNTVTVNVGGQAEEQAKAFGDLRLLLLLGIALVYMVMAAQFESLRDPFIVMFAVPFTFTGVIVAFWLTGTTLSVVTYLGMVMLMGIVVNNAIVLISYVGILRARGIPVSEAITTCGIQRLRPVLMTTLTTLAGLFPLAMSKGQGSETWQPLGITMIGGLLVSTLITMFFVPTLYAVFEDHRGGAKRWLRGLLSGRAGEPS